MTSPSPIYCHGAKHLLTGIRDQIMEVVNKLEHDVLVDPFAGSGTFASLDRRTTSAHLNFANHSDASEVGDWLINEGVYEEISASSREWEEFVNLTARDVAKVWRNALLLLDPPRPGSEHYGMAWNHAENDALLSKAVRWPGPVVIATYIGDMPSLQGNGWMNRRVVREAPVRALSNDFADHSVPMILWRRARDD